MKIKDSTLFFDNLKVAKIILFVLFVMFGVFSNTFAKTNYAQGLTGYTVVIESIEKGDPFQSPLERYKAEGIELFQQSVYVNGIERIRLCAGFYTNKKEADRLKDRINYMFNRKDAWVFKVSNDLLSSLGSPTNNTKPSGNISTNFEDYLKRFINVCCNNQNLDSLLFVDSPILTEFIHPTIGVGTCFNPGAFCMGGGGPFKPNYNFDPENYLRMGKVQLPYLSHLRYFAHKLPANDYCSEEPSMDGIYYKTVGKLPNYGQFNEDGNPITPKSFIPSKYKKSELMLVIIIESGSYAEQIYFIYADGKWWFVFLDNCDCSA